jgi:hypothetical protein
LNVSRETCVGIGTGQLRCDNADGNKGEAQKKEKAMTYVISGTLFGVEEIDDGTLHA